MIKLYHGTSIHRIKEIIETGALKSPYKQHLDETIKSLEDKKMSKSEYEKSVGKSVEEIVLNCVKNLYGKSEIQHRVLRYSLTADLSQSSNYCRQAGIILGFNLSKGEFSKKYLEDAEEILKDYEIEHVKKLLRNTKSDDLNNVFRTVYFKDDLPLTKLREILFPSNLSFSQVYAIKKLFNDYKFKPVFLELHQ